MYIVSLITGCYNGEKFITRCFESILRQTYPDVEVIFVDDGSTDNSLQLAKSHEKKFAERGYSFKVISQENMGFYPQTGIKNASGKYITTLDIDDVLLPDSIQKRAGFLEKNPEYSAARSNGYVVYQHDDAAPTELLINDFNTAPEDVFENLLYGKTSNIPGTYMVRADVLFEYYPDRTVPMNRFTQNLQILLPVTYRRKVGFIPEILMHYYRHDEAFTADIISYQERLTQFISFKEVRQNILYRMDLMTPEISAKLDRRYETIFLGVAKKYNEVEEFNKRYKAIKDPSLEERLLNASINNKKIGHFLLRLQNKIGLNKGNY